MRKITVAENAGFCFGVKRATERLEQAIAEAKAQGKGAIALRGKMIDAPIVARAERTIAMAQALGMERGI